MKKPSKKSYTQARRRTAGLREQAALEDCSLLERAPGLAQSGRREKVNITQLSPIF